MLAFVRGHPVFLSNFTPARAVSDYGFLVARGSYKTVLDSDSIEFGGYGRVDDNVEHFTLMDPLYKKVRKEWLKLYLPARSAMVLKKVRNNGKKIL